MYNIAGHPDRAPHAAKESLVGRYQKSREAYRTRLDRLNASTRGLHRTFTKGIGPMALELGPNDEYCDVDSLAGIHRGAHLFP